MKISIRLSHVLLLVAHFFFGCSKGKQPYSGWEIKGGTADGNQYSSLDQINISNVKDLKTIWTYASGDADTTNNRTQIQCNPIIVDGILYGTSPSLKPFALDAAKGKEIWKFDPPGENSGLGVNRGVTYWSDGKEKRILFTFGENLYSLDATTGNQILSFGDSGRVSLKTGLGERAQNLMVVSNTPGVIFKNLIIVGSRVHEGPMAAPGYIRAFDVITGKLVWTFNTIPKPGEFGYDTWPEDAWQRIGGANAWCGMTVDHKRGMVFAATGSASFDFYGGNRKGQNLFANCVLALDAATGERKWHFQTTHHDMWDRDHPAPPVLVTLNREDKKIDAVAQATKQGLIFVFDRESGQPIFDVEERPAPASDLDGEQAWPTQPFPVKPPAFARQVFHDSIINNLTPEIEAYVKEKIKGLKYGTPYIPPSKEGTVVFPGFDGGAEWGGETFDPTSGILYVNANEMPWNLQMVDVRLDAKTSLGLSLYRTNCTSCHGFDKKGTQQVPSLENITKKFKENTLTEFLSKGQRAMPAFTHLSAEERSAIARYLLNLDEKVSQAEKGNFERSPDIFFSNTGYIRMLTPEGYPMVRPPWGTLSAIDLNIGEIKWQIPIGEFKELKAKGIPPTGTENYGGPVATAGGLIFIAATRDEKFRAIDKANGSILWEIDLPAGGYSTPAVFEIKGKQIVVIACGGGKMGTKSGDQYVAFALP
jgi:quinoprotein glucose dehydrogenase